MERCIYPLSSSFSPPHKFVYDFWEIARSTVPLEHYCGRPMPSIQDYFTCKFRMMSEAGGPGWFIKYFS